MTDPDTHIWFDDGGYRACDTWADWEGADTTGVTCTECLEAANQVGPHTITYKNVDDKWEATWCDVSYTGTTRNEAIVGIANLMDDVDRFADDIKNKRQARPATDDQEP